MIDYAKFLSIRFDLVIQYYLLEKQGFDVRKARKSIKKNSQYKHLKNVFGQLLKVDIAENRNIKPEVKIEKATNTSEDSCGRYVAGKLFVMRRWSWVEEQMIEDDKWIRENPYFVRWHNGLGMSTKRFILALKYGRSLYWVWTLAEKNVPHRLWEQVNYERLLKSDEYRKIGEAKTRMVDMMGKLGFFSVDTYVGDRKFLKKD